MQPCFLSVGVSAATASDELLVLQSVAPFDDGVVSVHAGAATGVFGSCKVNDDEQGRRHRAIMGGDLVSLRRKHNRLPD